MVTRVEWLEAGMELLTHEGAPAITIERLTDQLGVTKGSYYHHFGSAAGFKTAMLEYFEAQFTGSLIEAVERKPEVEPGKKLAHLLRLVMSDPDNAALERAVRAWALQDPEVRATQERVDKARTAYLTELCRGIKPDVDPDRFAQLLYLILIGAEQILPPIARTDVQEIYTMTLQLIGRTID
ncbi:TetR/AcrR family transcriptional regulator [Kribbella sp. NPDC026611]|uniref:TetR/AcrR family transcriptional regulator n=1 Tax=Kribbella sp. NPDC026611 TaxID=3154911 RepID=UPI0033CCB95C